MSKNDTNNICCEIPSMLDKFMCAPLSDSKYEFVNKKADSSEDLGNLGNNYSYNNNSAQKEQQGFEYLWTQNSQCVNFERRSLRSLRECIVFGCAFFENILNIV